MRKDRFPFPEGISSPQTLRKCRRMELSKVQPGWKRTDQAEARVICCSTGRITSWVFPSQRVEHDICLKSEFFWQTLNYEHLFKVEDVPGQNKDKLLKNKNSFKVESRRQCKSKKEPKSSNPAVSTDLTWGREGKRQDAMWEPQPKFP